MRIPAMALLLVAAAAARAEMAPREGWEVMPTAKTYEALLEDTRAAVGDSPLAVVTQAGPTEAAAGRGIEIPGNRVIGVFNNDVAVRVLELSTAAMIEAPVRLYVTENADGTATLAYKRPSFVFAPYVDEGGDALMEIALELDGIFAGIAAAAAD